MMHIMSFLPAWGGNTPGWKSRQITEWSTWPRGHSDRWPNGVQRSHVSTVFRLKTLNNWLPFSDFEPRKRLRCCQRLLPGTVCFARLHFESFWYVLVEFFLHMPYYDYYVWKYQHCAAFKHSNTPRFFLTLEDVSRFLPSSWVLEIW